MLLRNRRFIVLLAGVLVVGGGVVALPQVRVAWADLAQVVVAGTFQQEVTATAAVPCADWTADCAATSLTQSASDSGLWTWTAIIPAGDWGVQGGRGRS